MKSNKNLLKLIQLAIIVGNFSAVLSLENHNFIEKRRTKKVGPDGDKQTPSRVPLSLSPTPTNTETDPAQKNDSTFAHFTSQGGLAIRANDNEKATPVQIQPGGVLETRTNDNEKATSVQIQPGGVLATRINDNEKATSVEDSKINDKLEHKPNGNDNATLVDRFGKKCDILCQTENINEGLNKVVEYINNDIHHHSENKDQNGEIEILTKVKQTFQAVNDDPSVADNFNKIEEGLLSLGTFFAKHIEHYPEEKNVANFKNALKIIQNVKVDFESLKLSIAEEYGYFDEKEEEEDLQNESEKKESGIKESEIKEPGIKEPEKKQPEKKQPEKKQPGKKQPGKKQPEKKQPEKKQPGKKQPGNNDMTRKRKIDNNEDIRAIADLFKATKRLDIDIPVNTLQPETYTQ
jgi:hypothetical protein